MSTARSSIETPAFMRRTFDWDRTSLLRGMSREDDRVIFGTAVVMVIISATSAERLSLSLGFQPVVKTGAALFLSSAATGAARDAHSLHILADLAVLNENVGPREVAE